jgi:hypothetical protein
LYRVEEDVELKVIEVWWNHSNKKTFSAISSRPFIEKKHERPSSQSSGGVKSSKRSTMTTPTNIKF